MTKGKHYVIAIACWSICFSGATFAVERRAISDVRLDQFILETQQESVSPLTLEGVFVWWFPKEYWQQTLQFVEAPERNAILNLVEDNLILAVCHYQIDPISGQRSYASNEEVIKGMRVSRLRTGKKTFSLTPLSHLEGNQQYVVDSLAEGIRQGALSHLADGVYFYVFEDRLRRSPTRQADPYEAGQLIVQVDGAEEFTHTIRFDTPLDSLFEPRTCPNGKPAHVSWEYCPWSGTKLEP